MAGGLHEKTMVNCRMAPLIPWARFYLELSWCRFLGRLYSVDDRLLWIIHVDMVPPYNLTLPTCASWHDYGAGASIALAGNDLDVRRFLLHLGSNFDCLHCLAAASEAAQPNYKNPPNS